MNIGLYALMTYGLTAVISFFVIAIIVVVNKAMNRSSHSKD